MGVFQKKIYLTSWKSEKLVKPAPHSLLRRLLLLPHNPQPARIRFQRVNWMFSPHGNIEIIKMDRMRKTIAEHMVRSKQTSAHVTTFNDVDVTNIVKWRNANKKTFQEQTGIKLTFTPIFIEAFIQAVGEFPLMNSSVDGDEIHLDRKSVV